MKGEIAGMKHLEWVKRDKGGILTERGAGVFARQKGKTRAGETWGWGAKDGIFDF